MMTLKWCVRVCVVLCFLLGTRLLAMWMIPLNDHTEARYGEIARMMLQTHDWVTLKQAPDEPFLAKPPLSTWLSAVSMSCLGVNAFAARLPAWLCALGVMGLCAWMMHRRHGLEAAWMVMVVLIGTPYFYLDAGVVMTDPSFVFATTIAMVSAYVAMQEKSRMFGFLFFIGLALGLLSKGPLVMVLVLGSLGTFVLLTGQWRRCWRVFPWGWGSLCMALMVLPWYYWAELRHPGFLNYFLIGEHFGRYLQSGWQGDQYGFAHATPYGMIWIFALGAMLPWISWVIYDGVHYRRMSWMQTERSDQWVTYLVCFIVVPLIFFTFSRNIIYTYTFVVIPPFALWFVERIYRTSYHTCTMMRVMILASMLGVASLGVTIVFLWKPALVSHAHDRMVKVWQDQHPTSDLIFWAVKPDYSARFYTHGHVKSTRDHTVLYRWLNSSKTSYVVVRSDQLVEIPEKYRRDWIFVTRLSMGHHFWLCYRAVMHPWKRAFVHHRSDRGPVIKLTV